MIAHPFFCYIYQISEVEAWRGWTHVLTPHSLSRMMMTFNLSQTKKYLRKRSKLVSNYIISFKWHTRNHVEFSTHWHLRLPADMLMKNVTNKAYSFFTRASHEKSTHFCCQLKVSKTKPGHSHQVTSDFSWFRILCLLKSDNPQWVHTSCFKL